MNKTRTIYSVLATIIGVFFVIYGVIDDSPGGQLLGLVLAIVGIIALVKNRKKF